ncbi:MAG: VOC family protein [Candidatus Sulfomarinibacteraceae bacterium]
MLSAAERPLPYFQRLTLVVNDLDKAFEVYRDLLGFTVDFVGGRQTDVFAYDIFGIPADVEIRFAALSSESQQRTMALIEAPGFAAGLSDRRAASVIQVVSVADTTARVRALGLEAHEPRTELDPANGPPRTEGGFYDHDGHTVVIYNLE